MQMCTKKHRKRLDILVALLDWKRDELPLLRQRYEDEVACRGAALDGGGDGNSEAAVADAFAYDDLATLAAPHMAEECGDGLFAGLDRTLPSSSSRSSSSSSQDLSLAASTSPSASDSAAWSTNTAPPYWATPGAPMAVADTEVGDAVVVRARLDGGTPAAESDLRGRWLRGVAEVVMRPFDMAAPGDGGDDDASGVLVPRGTAAPPLVGTASWASSLAAALPSSSALVLRGATSDDEQIDLTVRNRHEPTATAADPLIAAAPAVRAEPGGGGAGSGGVVTSGSTKKRRQHSPLTAATISATSKTTPRRTRSRR